MIPGAVVRLVLVAVLLVLLLVVLVKGIFMDNLKRVDSVLVDKRYTLATISKVAYKVIAINVGNDENILACTGLTIGELNSIKQGAGSIELLQRACADLYFQFIYAVGDNGIQARIKTASRVYRLTP